MSYRNYTYPGVPLALEQAGGDRARARDLIRAAILGQAMEDVLRAGLSANCERDFALSASEHACRNDGSGCICVCHDGKPTDEKASNKP